MRRHSTARAALVVWLLLFGCTLAYAAPPTVHYEIEVVLQRQGTADTFEWRSSLAANDVARLATESRRVAADYCRQAVKSLERRLGYFERLYGEATTTPRIIVIRVVATNLQTGTTQVLFERPLAPPPPLPLRPGE